MPHEHSHSHCHDDSCNSKGSQEHNHSHHHDHEEECCSKAFLHIADEAWMEVLKDKIKEQIIATSGPHLNELAKIISEANHGRWKNKMASKKGCKEFEEKICKFFSSMQ
jgi:hypothetical protein